jgi:hypothetical protein
VCVKYAYVGALVAIFLFSMGNRPVRCSISSDVEVVQSAHLPDNYVLQQGFVSFFPCAFCAVVIFCGANVRANNRSKWKYICAIIAFALLAVYMTLAAAFCAYRAIDGFSSDLVFAQLIISILTTYGCWVSCYIHRFSRGQREAEYGCCVGRSWRVYWLLTLGTFVRPGWSVVYGEICR